MNNDHKRNFLYTQLQDHHFDIIALQETHATDDTANRWQEEWYGTSFWNNLTNNSCGVAILVRPGLDCEVVDLQKDLQGRIIALTVTYQDYSFRIISIYAPNPEIRQRSAAFFEQLQDFSVPHLESIILGDFNMVEDTTLDREGGRPRELHTWGLPELRILKTNLNLTDVWREKNAKTRLFTWRSFHDNIYSRLDRIYFPQQLLPLVTHTTHHTFSWSDHDIVTVGFGVPFASARGEGYWKLNTSLLEDDDYKTLIQTFWDEWRENKQNYNSLSKWWDLGKVYIKERTIEFASAKNKRRREQRKNLLYDLREAERLHHPERMREARRLLKEHDQAQATRIFTQTKTQALEHGEKPTKYFYDLLKQKQQKNTLNKIYIMDPHGNRQTSNKIDDILSETTAFYKSLYTAEDNLDLTEQQKLIDALDQQLTQQDKTNLDADITKDELTKALMGTENGKTPGWDGLPFEFYKTFWHILSDDFLQIQHEALNTNQKLPNSQQRALVSLLYKAGDKADLTNWRPLSLLCTDYKIITKTISNRIKNILSIIIHEDQTCSVPGRTIHSNLLLTRDVINYTNRKNIKGFIITIDQEKAFDRVDRKMLFKTLKRMNFGDKMISWIKTIYKDPRSALYINGHIGEIFRTERGVRQGCPLSAILYVILAEVLGTAIRTSPNIRGIALPGTQHDLKITQYADDTTFFINNRTNIDNVFAVLRNYERHTGTKIKTNKTKAIALGGAQIPYTNVDITWRDLEGIPILGIDFFTDELHTLNVNWLKQIQKFQDYIENTKMRGLSFRGKTLNLNTKALAGFWFLATIFPFPTWLKTDVNRTIFSYIWGQKNESIKRATLFLTKQKGGLGIFSPEKRSVALRTKFINQICDPQNKSKCVYLARYYIGFHLGSLKHEWLFLRTNLAPRLTDHNYPEYYGDILNLIKRVDISKIQWETNFFYEQTFTRDNHTPNALQNWRTIRDVPYKWDETWQYLHNSFSPGKYQELHYKFLHLALPTRKRIATWRSMGHLNPNCVYCRQNNTLKVETHLHLFFDCPIAFELWSSIKTIIQKLIPAQRVQTFMLTMGIFPTTATITTKRLIATLIQLTLHAVWINRNMICMDQEQPVLDISIGKIQRKFKTAINAVYKKMKMAHNVAGFRKNYCHNNTLISLDASLNLVLSF